MTRHFLSLETAVPVLKLCPSRLLAGPVTQAIVPVRESACEKLGPCQRGSFPRGTASCPWFQPHRQWSQGEQKTLGYLPASPAVEGFDPVALGGCLPETHWRSPGWAVPPALAPTVPLRREAGPGDAAVRLPAEQARAVAPVAFLRV